MGSGKRVRTRLGRAWNNSLVRLYLYTSFIHSFIHLADSFAFGPLFREMEGWSRKSCYRMDLERAVVLGAVFSQSIVQDPLHQRQ